MKHAFRVAWIAGLLAVPLSAAASQAADKNQPNAQAESEHHHGWMKEKLGLSDEQSQKVEAAWKGHREALKPLREQLRKAVKKVRGELDIEASDKDIQAALEQVAKARKALSAKEEELRQALDAMLTPAQRAKMLLLREKMMRHGMMTKGKCHDGRPRRDKDRGERDKDGWHHDREE